MSILATVLYEDTMLPNAGGTYPLHDLVMRIVEDDINGETWRLRKLIEKNPRRGIGNVLKDLGRTGLIAGAGRLFLLVDRDVIAEQLGLPSTSSDDELVAAMRGKSDAPDKLDAFFLLPNVEGLLRAIQTCDPELLPENMTAALNKKLNERDIVFNEVKKAARAALRKCVREAQPGLDALAKAIAAIIPAGQIGGEA